MATIEPRSRRTVQLLHRLPDGSSHVDWMIAADDRAGSPLLTFRLPGPIAAPGAGAKAMAARRLPDHRAIYLAYEGPVAEAPGAPRREGPPVDRGTVRCVRRGRVVAWDRGEVVWEMAIVWEPEETAAPAPGTAQRLRLVHHRGGRWTLIPV